MMRIAALLIVGLLAGCTHLVEVATGWTDLVFLAMKSLCCRRQTASEKPAPY